jgi:hypothetical protein
MREIKLFWEGLWDITEQDGSLNISEAGGILMLLDARHTPNKIGFDTGTYRLVELCEVSNMHEALQNKFTVQNWKRLCNNRLLLKISKIDNPTDRKEILMLLKGSAEAPDNLQIFNIGYKLPLKAQYTPVLKESTV